MKSKSFSILIILILIFLSSFALGAPSNNTLEALDLIQVQHLILEWIREAHVDSVSSSELLQGAVDGMIKKLDPHSSFMQPKKAQDFNEKLRGDFQGIGITFTMINDKITVIEAIPGGPSEAAGLTSRDKIVKIDGIDAVGINEDSVKVLLRGKANTKVKVHIERPGEKKLLKYTITRNRIRLNSVSHAYMIDDTTGYIALTRFSIKTHEDVKNALLKLKSLGMQRLILDLRGNTGGSLEAAVWVVKFFITNGTVVYTKGKRDNDNNTWLASPHKYPVYTDIPLIVMINHGSASASEIVAGALQDHDRALIVGQTSFGKGLVMNSFPIISHFEKKNLGTLMLSVARYYTPSGRLIQRPYDNGREEYIKEGFDDIDPNAADSSKAGKPVYLTDLGREVYGGGGITPDRIIDRSRKLNKYEAALRATHVFFEFADDYLLRHDDIPGYFMDFLLNYRIPENEIERFRKYAIDRSITSGDEKPFRQGIEKLLKKYDIGDETIHSVMNYIADAGTNIDELLFDKSRDFIERNIKQEIARMIWESEARYRIIHTDDTELITALSYFDEAAELLARRLAIGDL